MAIEKGLLFVEQLDRRQHESVIDRSLIQELENTLKHSLNDLEKETKRILCASRFLRDYQQSPPDAIRNNLTIFKDNLGNFSLSYDEA